MWFIYVIFCNVIMFRNATEKSYTLSFYLYMIIILFIIISNFNWISRTNQWSVSIFLDHHVAIHSRLKIRDNIQKYCYYLLSEFLYYFAHVSGTYWIKLSNGPNRIYLIIVIPVIFWFDSAFLYLLIFQCKKLKYIYIICRI